jgi:Holliday junction resolvase
MSITKEGSVKKDIKAILDTLGVYYFMPSGNGYGRSAIPDFVGCYKGHFIAIEAKADNLQATAIQQRELNRISSHEGVGICINAENIGELRGILEALK